MKLLTIVLLIGAGAVAAQNQPAVPANPAPHHPPSGKLSAEIDADVPAHLFDLTRIASLIVDGTVASVPAAVTNNPDPNLPYAETDSIVSVNAVLKGTLPSNGSLELAQIGGKVGKWDISAAGDPLVKVGERYILFLMPDGDRKNPAPRAGVPRYGAVGVWAGKVKVVSGKVQFLPRASQQLHGYDNTDIDSFISVVESYVNGTFPTDPNLPIQPPVPGVNP